MWGLDRHKDLCFSEKLNSGESVEKTTEHDMGTGVDVIRGYIHWLCNRLGNQLSRRTPKRT